jgi:hypothetical protein
MAGDELKLSPVPHFWLVKYKHTTTYTELHGLAYSFEQLGFHVYYRSDEFLTFKISHTKPKYMSLWLMTNSELAKKFRLVITEYTHNEKKKSNVVL